MPQLHEMNPAIAQFEKDHASIGSHPIRSAAPVFVVGCPRSGTTVLYHMLLSSGNFAIYRTESNVFNLLVPRFRGMRSVADRKKLLDVWVRSRLFRDSGLDLDEISAKIIQQCDSGGKFLRLLMQDVACKQGMKRWADCTPEHLLYMCEIKRQIPDALFIHIIRDGRDVALSYAKQNWSHPLPWDHSQTIDVAGLYWEWLVRRGREQGKILGGDYMEVHFEDLIARPEQTLSQIGSFIDHDLNYERICRAGIGSVSKPNTSFAGKSKEEFHPVERWKSMMSPQQVAAIEAVIGECLSRFGYPLACEAPKGKTLRTLRMRTTYHALFAAKHWMRTKTPLGRFVNLDRIEIEPRPAG